MQISQGPLPRPRREFHELYMPMSQVFEKLKAKWLLKPLDPRPITNPLPSRFVVNKRYAYHQGPGHDTDRCFSLCHAIQDLIDNKVIAPTTRPSITNNPLPNHNFGRRMRINCLMTEEESKEDPSELIYDLPECFMMTWEELMGMTSTIGYDIWSEDALETKNYPTSTNGGRHFKLQSNYPISTNGERHFEPQSSNSTSTNRGRHFKTPPLETNNLIETLNKSTQQTLAEEDEFLKQLQKTQANISLWGLLTASYKHRQNLVDLLNQIQVPTTTTSQDMNAMIRSISRELTISYFDKDLTKKGKHHNDPLHITVDAKGKRISMVLIDDGSVLKVCHLKIASCLGLSIEDFVLIDQDVRAYGKSRREVLGTVTLELTIGPMIKKVEFQVLNIASCFNMLLGQPWIHDTEAVPSSLYNKVRFPHEGYLSLSLVLILRRSH